MPGSTIYLPWNFYSEPRIPPLDFAVWCYLQAEWTGGRIHIKNMATRIGVCKRSVDYALQRLREKGWITDKHCKMGETYDLSPNGTFYWRRANVTVPKKKRVSPQAQLYDEVADRISELFGAEYDRLDCDGGTMSLIHKRIQSLGQEDLRARLDILFEQPECTARIFLDTTGWTVRKIFSAGVLQQCSNQLPPKREIKKMEKEKWEKLEAKVRERLLQSRSPSSGTS